MGILESVEGHIVISLAWLIIFLILAKNRTLFGMKKKVFILSTFILYFWCILKTCFVISTGFVAPHGPWTSGPHVTAVGAHSAGESSGAAKRAQTRERTEPSVPRDAARRVWQAQCQAHWRQQPLSAASRRRHANGKRCCVKCEQILCCLLHVKAYYQSCVILPS